MVYFTHTQNNGTDYYFFSKDGVVPVSEYERSLESLQHELKERNITHVAVGLFALGNGQYGCYAQA